MKMSISTCSSIYIYDQTPVENSVSGSQDVILVNLYHLYVCYLPLWCLQNPLPVKSLNEHEYKQSKEQDTASKYKACIKNKNHPDKLHAEKI
jgi:hypothetical protein